MIHAPLRRVSLRRVLALAGFSILALGTAAPAHAADDMKIGDASLSIDSTLSEGAIFRMEGRDCHLIARSNGGCGFSSNGDDGDLNYGKGLVAAVTRLTSEAALSYQNYGAFVRGTAFFDPKNSNTSSTDFRDLSSAAQQRVGRDVRLLDAYVYGKFDAEDHPLDVRLGNQVLNWGESTFIPNGINVINPYDVSALRLPGTELKEGLLPTPLADVNFGITDNLSLEAFYQFMWNKTAPEAAGTYFSTSEIISPGAKYVQLGYGNPLVPDSPYATAVPGVNNFGSDVFRDKSQDPKDSGQFGAALRYYAEELGGTEFGLYGMNYHSRLPVINARTGTVGLTPATIATYSSRSSYYAAYPENQQLYGGSFNTNLPFGISLQGEYSFRHDQPLQVDDVELLQAATAPQAVAAACAAAAAGAVTPGNQALCAGTAAAFQQNQIIKSQGGFASPGTPGTVTQASAANTIASISNNFGDQEIQGFRRFDVSSLDISATKAFGPVPALNADQWSLIAEVGAAQVHNMPNKSVMRFEGPGTYRGGNALVAGPEGVEPEGGFADAFSWGIRARARFDYLNVADSFNVYPYVSYQWDINGTTPAPLGTFVDGRQAVGLGVQATYMESWSAEASYNFFYGGGQYNLLRDRDFVSVTLKYSF